jgi:hypothetical protein
MVYASFLAKNSLTTVKTESMACLYRLILLMTQLLELMSAQEDKEIAARLWHQWRTGNRAAELPRPRA